MKCVQADPIETAAVSLEIDGAAPKPLLKWAGGKRALIPKIKPLITTKNRYIEPFFGGGAIFFSATPKNAILGDINSDLISCYEVVRDNPTGLLESLESLTNSEENYYRIRKWAPTSLTERAARLIYLCNLSFNGIFRVNRGGLFNVPYGKKTHLPSFDRNSILATSRALMNVELFCADFEIVSSYARKGDCVYFDPPYTVAHGSNGFLKYNEHIFSWQDQVRLKSVALELVRRGVKVVISNADHPSLRELFGNFKVLTLTRWSVISAKSAGRKNITECVFYLGE